MTKVSILTPCFNHEKYIKQFLDSVLAQTNQNFELVIVDDCSTDKTVSIIKSYNDEHIKFIKHDFNKGINAVLNTAFEASSGDVISFISSDDMLKPNYIEKIIKIFDENKNISVVYNQLATMNETGEIQSKRLKPKFNNKFKNLERIFYTSNPLLSPGMAVKREAFNYLYKLNPLIVNQQDLQMHVKLLIKNNVKFLDEELVIYRLPNEISGISVRSNTTETRENLELDFVLDEFLKIDNVETLKQIFGNKLDEIGIPTVETIPYFLCKLALSSNDDRRKSWGYKTLIKYLNNEDNLNLLNKLYGFNFKEFLSYTKYFGETEEQKLNRKVKKYKSLFNFMLIISVIVIILLPVFLFLIK